MQKGKGQAMATTSAQPHLYERIRADLAAKIGAGSLAVGSYLPSEVQLGKQYRTTRVTVRRALKLLQEEGLLRNRPGKGWWVRGGEGEDDVGVTPLRVALYGFDMATSQEVLLGFQEELRQCGHACVPVIRDLARDKALPTRDAVDSILYFSVRGVPLGHRTALCTESWPAVCCGCCVRQVCDAVTLDVDDRVDRVVGLLEEAGSRNHLFLIPDPRNIPDPSFARMLAAYQSRALLAGRVPQVELIPRNTLVDYPASELRRIEDGLAARFRKAAKARCPIDGVITVSHGLGQQLAALLSRNRLISGVCFGCLEPGAQDLPNAAGVPLYGYSRKAVWRDVGRVAARRIVARRQGDRLPSVLHFVHDRGHDRGHGQPKRASTSKAG
jgi:hypothetical protein